MVIAIVISVILLVLMITFLSDNYRLKSKYSKIIDIDSEVNKRAKAIKQQEKDIEKLQNSYKEKRAIYEELNSTVKLLTDDIEMMEVGLYKPSFNFDTSEEYKNKLNQNYEKQKILIKNKKAVVCSTTWTTNGSKREGQKMTDKWIKLMLKAFNGECESIIAKVRWNNYNKMLARMTKAFNDLNKYGESHDTRIQRDYLRLKEEELSLTYEYEQKKYEEKEEQRRIREQIREEEKAQKEFEKARLKAEKEEADYQRALKQAQEELSKANEAERSKYEMQIAKLQQQLKEAEELKKRAISQAQMTKSGHVYVISNIGSFGENVYKIGMTRRLEPEDRVNELGDASVPFKFDIHAMISSDDAPALENKLHEVFKEKSVNRINYRKEFFKVTLDEIEEAVKQYTNADITFTKIAEAKEYRESLAIVNAENNIKLEPKQSEDFPLEI